MANVTIYEFGGPPDDAGSLTFPPDRTTTVASSATHTLNDGSTYIIVCADADCRIGFNAAAVASGMPVLSAVPNPFRLQGGHGRTLQFL